MSPVIGQVPLLAKVAARTELLWQFISRELSCIGEAHYIIINRGKQNKFYQDQNQTCGYVPGSTAQGFSWYRHREENIGFLSENMWVRNLYRLSPSLPNIWSCWIEQFHLRPFSKCTKAVVLISWGGLSIIWFWEWHVFSHHNVTSNISMTNSYFLAKSSSSGRTSWSRSDEDERAPELINGLNGLSIGVRNMIIEYI